MPLAIRARSSSRNRGVKRMPSFAVWRIRPLTVATIDHPFAGTVKVGPEALATVVKDFAAAPAQR
jgi:hypothetical protein